MIFSRRVSMGSAVSLSAALARNSTYLSMHLAAEEGIALKSLWLSIKQATLECLGFGQSLLSYPY